MILKNIIKLLDVLWRPGGLKAAMTARPRSLASFRILARMKFVVGEIGTVIDAGANIGQFARAASSAYPDAAVISFEPLPDVAEKLRSNLRDVQQHEVYEMALGNEDGSTTFRRASEDGQSSSILPFITREESLISGVTEIEQLEVKIAKLDTVFTGRSLVSPVCLKLDLQGYELEALKGATELLGKCDYVLVETVLERSYEGEPHFVDIVKFLERFDMTCRSLLGAEENDRGQIAQVDALFVRQREQK